MLVVHKSTQHICRCVVRYVGSYIFTGGAAQPLPTVIKLFQLVEFWLMYYLVFVNNNMVVICKNVPNDIWTRVSYKNKVIIISRNFNGKKYNLI